MTARLFHRLILCSVVWVAFCSVAVIAQQKANTNAIYHQLRTLLPGPVSIPVDNVVFRRDAATFTFTHGAFALCGEVNGKITGAVFSGTGHFHLTPPTNIERHNLEILTRKPEFDEDFTSVVLHFTDGTAEEIRKAGAGKTGPQDGKLVQDAQEFRTFQREHLFENIDLRLLEDVLSPGTAGSGGFFLAAIHGVANGHILFEIDPHGAPNVEPEEVRLGIWNSWGWSYPSAFHLAGEYDAGTASGRQVNTAFRVDTEEMETSIEKSGWLGGNATVHIQALEDGLAVVPLSLFPSLRVSQVEGEHGESLDFVQEDKKEDSDFGLVLSAPLKKDQTVAVKVTYGGKDAVKTVGGENYDPVARETWFPNAGIHFGSYTRYKMVFHTSKDDDLIATGNRLSNTVDGKVRTSEWDSMMPLPVAGFHLGKFKEQHGKTQDGSIAMAAYANEFIPDWASTIIRQGGAGDALLPQGSSHAPAAAFGNLNTVSMLPVELSQGTVAAQIYTSYFGKLPFDHMALSQQPACNYGQSWPMLVYLPICGFWDGTIQIQLGLSPSDPYWKSVTAHEVAHQWWGHTIGFMSYRDQWMSEGFAQASAAIYLRATSKSQADYQDFWRQLKDQLTVKNRDGFRPIDVGPVTMGYRLNTNKTGFDVYRNLVYPKGAYILHMIQTFMWSEKTGDDGFRAMMHDFIDTYRLKVATTEDFKAIVEKHMTAGMDIDKNHKMDWFFNEYVYGTDLPHYHFESQVSQTADGTSLHFKLTQSGVPDGFKMLIPLYVELGDGRTLRLGLVGMAGNNTAEQTVPFGKSPIQIKRATIDSNQDILAVEN